VFVAQALQCLDERHAWHRHVEIRPGDGVDQVVPARDLAGDGHVWILLDEVPESGADHRVVVSNEDANHVVPRVRADGRA
jgi:hypothetical protein